MLILQGHLENVFGVILCVLVGWFQIQQLNIFCSICMKKRERCMAVGPTAPCYKFWNPPEILGCLDSIQNWSFFFKTCFYLFSSKFWNLDHLKLILFLFQLSDLSLIFISKKNLLLTCYKFRKRIWYQLKIFNSIDFFFSYICGLILAHFSNVSN